ncbi:ankyrin [Neocallimastix californiae]|uniref:Ankyrin n=1 Tax=Neocallimastix californiae TaxID=1754190 RepID=A0A1Y2EID6_9FUNG|nr:ankyrin [Neocallimastix californiae]|eukprot:ORY70555.1 ankyrin [Neocallimastix californiae]
MNVSPYIQDEDDININKTNHQGESVLTYCIKNNIIEPICKFLLHNTNIDVNITDNEGKTPAMYLTEKGLYLNLLKLHAKRCSYGYINMNGIKELLKNDPTVINEVNNKNENELIIASKINQVKVVEILLERGIYIDHQDNFGNMALHYAVDIQEPYLIYKLMSKKSNVHLKNNEVKFNNQSTNKYFEEIQKYVIPYANNNFPDFKSTNEMENTKYDIYQRNATTLLIKEQY